MGSRGPLTTAQKFIRTEDFVKKNDEGSQLTSWFITLQNPSLCETLFMNAELVEPQLWSKSCYKCWNFKLGQQMREGKNSGREIKT